MENAFCATIILSLGLTSCNSSTDQKKIEILDKPHETEQALQRDLADSSKLIKIGGQFYKNRAGHLYERTFAQRDADGPESFFEYFNGKIPQNIDPLTFCALDGWYAKDKCFAYYYRPTSGGMLCIKMDKADVKTFKIFQGHYQYAVDKKHMFKDGEILENMKPGKARVITDKTGEIISVK
ncbi:hypothetical protein ACVWYF_000636 [Hymenobacter sp. UYAg731]